MLYELHAELYRISLPLAAGLLRYKQSCTRLLYYTSNYRLYRRDSNDSRFFDLLLSGHRRHYHSTMDGSKLKVLDGGLGSMLEHSFPISDDPLWSASLLYSQPEAIKKTHVQFLENGAEVVITASYQACVEGFCDFLKVSKEEAIDLIKRSATLACEARDEYLSSCNKKQNILVAGSVGPYGACQHDSSEYHGRYVETVSMDVIKEWHRHRISALISAGVDLLAIETFPALKEAVAMTELLKEFPQISAWIAFSCKDEEHTCYGDKFSDVVATLSPCPQILGIGINCSAPCHVTPLLESAQCNKTDKPFVVYPNSETCKRDWQHNSDFSQSPATYVERWVELGARWIGGCCHTTFDDIRQIKEKMDKLAGT